MLFLPSLFLVFLLPLALCAEDFYKLLNIDKGASDREIKKAYRTLSKKFHPDKNPGNDTASARFVAIAEAYEALSDTELRSIYDKYGHDGVAQHKSRGGGGGGGGSHDPFDLFSRFFGGSGHFGHSSGVRRGPDMEVRVAVPLRDFYTGQEHEFSLEKQQICEECEGTGSADGTTEGCDKCGGRGAVLQKHMLAPGIFQQVQMQCDKCGGKGKVVKHPCKVCGGSRVVQKVATHTLRVEKGMRKGSTINYENEANESPDWEAGDLLVHVVEKEADMEEEGQEGARSDGTFMRRKGRDLYWKEVLSLREAWMGDWSRKLVHLDGHIVELGRKRGDVIQPNQVDVIAGEGMPIPIDEQERDKAGEEEYGNLVVEYIVVLPDQIEKPMEKEFWALWEKWRKKIGVDLDKELGRPGPKSGQAHGEL
ncbi:MAG: DnaJ- protein scj1 [Ramalina farinacea]|uniref:DnaJ- protein scj1 n=1 Tax=Ramalina farinacea TaxID=258253 RepID=A0AA43QNW4_9LECA|nr:DnaJ- protein scj1 [Ramalina farinacea]